jgi:hypothetical protein
MVPVTPSLQLRRSGKLHKTSASSCSTCTAVARESLGRPVGILAAAGVLQFQLMLGGCAWPVLIMSHSIHGHHFASEPSPPRLLRKVHFNVVS